jgi:diacylglycerol kinase family enzyme
MINIGFDCAVAREASRLKFVKRISPSFSYTIGVIKIFFRKIGTKMRLIFDDGEVLEDVYTLTAIGNGKFCGGGYCAAPYAKMTDGIFDICCIKKVTRFTLVRLISSYRKGSYVNLKKAKKYFEIRRTDHFKMEFDMPVPICIDGEIKGAKTIDFSIVRNAFNFVIPKGSDFIDKD